MNAAKPSTSNEARPSEGSEVSIMAICNGAQFLSEQSIASGRSPCKRASWATRPAIVVILILLVEGGARSKNVWPHSEDWCITMPTMAPSHLATIHTVASPDVFRLVRGSRFCRRGSLVATLTLFLCAPLGAQQFKASVNGNVTDQQRAMLPGVSVTILNVDTNVPVETVTDPKGVYEVQDL